MLKKIIDRLRGRALVRRACHLEKEDPSNPRMVECLCKASKLGSEDGTIKLAEIYLNKDVPDSYDPGVAIKLLKRLSKRGSARGAYLLGREMRRRGEDDNAVKYLSLACEKGYAPAQFFMGLMMIQGFGIGKNVKSGLRHIRKSANSGNPEAQYYLAVSYFNGRNVAESHDKALYWARKAALSGYKDAQMLLSGLYEVGIGIERDPRESFFWMLQAARQDDADAQAFVGECFLAGRGVRRNEKKGFRYCGMAVAQGNGFASARVGLCYIFGRGVNEDKEKGTALLKKTAKDGYKYAPVYLALLGQERIIKLSKTEVRMYGEMAESEGINPSLAEEPLPFPRRKESWVESEYDTAVTWRHFDEYYDAEDEDESIPGPFDPLLKLMGNFFSHFSRYGSKH